jgi:hypothetical protein
MSPILGIYASQISGHLFTLSGSYDALASVTVPSGGLSSVTFAGIPQTYSHLQVRYSGNTSSTGASFNMTLNGTTPTAYWHYLTGFGGGVAAGAVNDTVIKLYGAYAGTTAYPTVGITDILDYSNTNKYKTVRTLAGSDGNGSGEIQFTSGLFSNTSSITSLTVIASAGTFTQYSQFSLYGVK